MEVIVASIVFVCCCCGGSSDKQYINNSLSTGDVPYPCSRLWGDDSSITVRTSGGSNCDIVVVVKRNNTRVRSVYIKSGDSYTFNLPNGRYQVFFYEGRGWNPNLEMPNGDCGGFVSNVSYSKDDYVYLDFEELEYQLIPQRNGNFSPRNSSINEIF